MDDLTCVNEEFSKIHGRWLSSSSLLEKCSIIFKKYKNSKIQSINIYFGLHSVIKSKLKNSNIQYILSMSLFTFIKVEMVKC